jgi:hypothetical protein
MDILYEFPFVQLVYVFAGSICCAELCLCSGAMAEGNGGGYISLLLLKILSL